MILREYVPLSTLTTLRVGGTARYVYTCTDLETLKTAVTYARDCGLPLYPLGQGSNLLAPDTPYEGVILKMENVDVEFNENGDEVEVVSGAGYSWDILVDQCTERGLWGIENLAGIPGTVGAAPVQNIGAYGSELKDTLAWVECYDTNTDSVLRITTADCALGYRDSRFKREPNLIITRVALRLSQTGTPHIAYADLTREAETGAVLDTPISIAAAVRRIRGRKFPDLKTHGTAGSFFKNPTVTVETYAALKEEYPELPGFETSSGIKIALAWILDHVLALRGFRIGPAWLYTNQPLVLVTDEGATAHDVNVLAEEVAARVHAATGIAIEREVRSL